MPRFITSRDFEFIQHINREAVSDLIDTLVVVYKVIPGETKTNVYGESMEKVRYVGVSIPCFIKYDKPTVVSDQFPMDTNQVVEFRFVRRILEEAQFFPEKGDIVGYNDLFYEIDNTIDTQLLGGRPEFSTSILCIAHLTRKSGLSIEPRATWANIESILG